MKKITIGLLMLLLANMVAFSQDYKKLRTALTLFQAVGGDAKLEEAKTEIDKLNADPKAQGKPETNLLKAEVYGSIAGSETLKTKYPTAAQEGFDALKKYLQQEPAADKYKEDGYMGVNGIYTTFFNRGIEEYKAKSWDSSYAEFKQLVAISDIMIKNKWSNVAFDTNAYLFAGITSQNANKEDEAVQYYEKLTDLKVKGADYEHIYAFLPQYYSKRKNDQAFKKSIATSRAVYPDKTLWNDLEFEYATDNMSIDELSKKFDDDLAANRLTSASAMDYGGYFFNDKKIKALKPEEKASYSVRAGKAFEKAAELDPSNTLATYNAAVVSYAAWGDADDNARAIKGVTPDVKAKRAQADKVALVAYDKAAESLEKAYKQLDAKSDKNKVEKNSQNSAAKFLAVVYSWRRDKAKGKAAEYDMYDKKFQFYDKKY